MKSDSLKKFCEALKSHDHYLLSCHVLPEGDAVGSILAMDSLLRRLGKKTMVVCQDSFPERLCFLSGHRYWHRADDLKKKGLSFKTLVVADSPTLDRIGRVKNLLHPDAVIFNIDHHVSNACFGHFNYIRPEAAASAEVITEIFHYLKIPISKEDAANLYVAISTDTGSFKYSNTTVHCLRIAAELLTAGIDVEKINEQIYATYSLNKINLYSRLLARVRTAARGRVAWAEMKREDLLHSGANYEDTEGFIDFLKYLKEVKVAFFLVEMPHTAEVKVSFRSKGNYDVNKIATHFSGGGHKKASGCTLKMTIEDAEKVVLKKILKTFRFS